MKKFFYRVKPNDTIFSVCNQFDIPITALIYDNKLKKDISEGDILYIFVPSGKKYYPSPLDDYFSVSQKTGVSVESLKEKNKAPYLVYGAFIIV